MELRTYEYTITGISPLIFHWDNIEWADDIEATRQQIKTNDKAAFKAGDDRCPPYTWLGYCYNDGSQVVLPTENLRTCFVKAAGRVTLKGKETFKKLIAGSVIWDDELITLLVNGRSIEWNKDLEDLSLSYKQQVEAVRKAGFDLFMKRAAVGRAKHVRVRPIFRKWSARGTIIVTDDQVTKTVIEEVARYAGSIFGIGDWRPGAPSAPGPYGRFNIVFN